jgi:hypothetical protein
MGELSSWPVMAISHHFLVRWSYAAFGYKQPQKASYCVLGDDLTLRSHGVAKIYMHIISCLGMEYSVDKTYIGFGVAEFAKSLFCQGEDLTPFPVALLLFRYNTVVSTVLAIMSECKSRNLALTAQTIVGMYPARMRALVLLAALSPKSPKSVLDLQSRKDDWIFQQFILQQKIKYFSRLSTVRDSTHAFAINDPGNSGKVLASPYLQIAMDNGNSYPVRYLKTKDRSLDPEILLGSNWISYNTKCWPNGLPTIGDQRLIPGPTWVREKKTNLNLRSSLLELDKILPGYFTVRCVGKQVGEVVRFPAKGQQQP